MRSPLIGDPPETRPDRSPELGMGATILKYTERAAATVIEITTFKSGARKGLPKEVLVQYDDFVILDGDESDGSARYSYSSNPENRTVAFVMASKGKLAGNWVEKGLGGRGWLLLLGQRERRRNPYL